MPNAEADPSDAKPAKRQRSTSTAKAEHPLGTESQPARFCRVHSDGSVTWDADKFQVALEAAELEDELFLRNVVRGTIVCGGLFPLVFDQSDDPTAKLRSLSFFRQLVAEPAGYAELDDNQRMHVWIGVRDLFFADSRGLLSEEEHNLMLKMTEVVDSTPLGQLGGLGFHCCPTSAAKSVRFTAELKELDAELAGCFATVKEGEQTYFAVFVNQQELSFHNFENILPLDRALSADKSMELELTGLEQLNPKQQLFQMAVVGESVPMLEQLRDMESLYVAPLNAGQRGGQRFIFQSQALSKSLTRAVRKSGLLEKLDRANFVSCKFVSVNSVFRCNRFCAGDAKFESHRDTPYFDGARSHVSRYTLLLYLTGGRGKPALKVEGTEVEEVGAMTCVVFDQSYEHEGQPYEAGAKVFLRSELIFEVDRCDLKRCPEAAALFSSACYMTGQSVFDAQLSAYAHQCYEQVNALHWGLPPPAPRQPLTFLLKTLPAASTRPFMTNGHDYWFPQSAGTLEECAVVALLDHFNCAIATEGAFRSLCKSQTLQGAGTAEWVWAQLAQHMAEERVAGPGKREEECRAGKLSAGRGREEAGAAATAERRLTRGMARETSSGGGGGRGGGALVNSKRPLPKSKGRRHHPARIGIGKSAQSAQRAARGARQTAGGKTAGGGMLRGVRLAADEEKAAVWAEALGEVPERGPEEGSHCCPFHSQALEEEDDDFVSWKCDDVVELFKGCREWSHQQLLSAPILFLGREVVIDSSCVVVQGDKIYVRDKNRAGHAQPINFAACWNDESRPPCYIDVKERIAAPKLLLPPITFTRSQEGYRLMLDFFKNDWMLQVDLGREVLVPQYLKTYDDIDIDHAPFFEAANPKYDVYDYAFGSNADFEHQLFVGDDDEDSEDADEEDED